MLLMNCVELLTDAISLSDHFTPQGAWSEQKTNEWSVGLSFANIVKLVNFSLTELNLWCCYHIKGCSPSGRSQWCRSRNFSVSEGLPGISSSIWGETVSGLPFSPQSQYAAPSSSPHYVDTKVLEAVLHLHHWPADIKGGILRPLLLPNSCWHSGGDCGSGHLPPSGLFIVICYLRLLK